MRALLWIVLFAAVSAGAAAESPWDQFRPYVPPRAAPADPAPARAVPPTITGAGSLRDLLLTPYFRDSRIVVTFRAGAIERRAGQLIEVGSDFLVIESGESAVVIPFSAVLSVARMD